MYWVRRSWDQSSSFSYMYFVELEVTLQQQLLDRGRANLEVDRIFLRRFAGATGSHWASLAALLSYTAAETERFLESETPALQVLQGWKLATRPTYGYLLNILRAPFLLPSFFRRFHVLCPSSAAGGTELRSVRHMEQRNFGYG